MLIHGSANSWLIHGMMDLANSHVHQSFGGGARAR